MPVLDQIASYSASGDPSVNSTFSANPATGASVLVAVGTFATFGIPSGATVTDNALPTNTYTQVPGATAQTDNGCTIAWYECATPQMPPSGTLEVTFQLPSGDWPSIQAFSVLGSIDAMVATEGIQTGNPVSLTVTSTQNGDLFLGVAVADTASVGSATWSANFPTTNLSFEGLVPTNQEWLATAALQSYPAAGAQTWSIGNTPPGGPVSIAMILMAIAPGASGPATNSDVLVDQAPASHTAGGTSATFSIAGVSALQMALDVSAVSPGSSPGVTLYLEGEGPDDNWYPLTSIASEDGPTLAVYSPAMILPTVRLRWDLGSNTSATFGYWLTKKA